MTVPEEFADFIEDINKGYRTYVVSLANNDGVQGVQFTLKDKLTDLFLRRKNKKIETKSVRTRDGGNGTKEVLVKTTAAREEFESIIRGITCLNTATYDIFDGTFEEIIARSEDNRERADRLELENGTLEERVTQLDGQKRNAEGNFAELKRTYTALKEEHSLTEALARQLADTQRDAYELQIKNLTETIKKLEELSANNKLSDANEELVEELVDANKTSPEFAQDISSLTKQITDLQLELSQRPTLEKLREVEEQKKAFEDQYTQELSATRLTGEQEKKYKGRT